VNGIRIESTDEGIKDRKIRGIIYRELNIPCAKVDKNSRTTTSLVEKKIPCPGLNLGPTEGCIYLGCRGYIQYTAVSFQMLTHHS
jgi:hypothetical protein